jgi:hypothetical protein
VEGADEEKNLAIVKLMRNGVRFAVSPDGTYSTFEFVSSVFLSLTYPFASLQIRMQTIRAGTIGSSVFWLVPLPIWSLVHSRLAKSVRS